VVVRRSGAVALLLLLTGCGAGEPAGPGEVGVTVGPQDLSVRPVQYCLDGEGQRYDNTPPILEVSPDAAITLTVPEVVAENGWSVQVFDETLEERLGTVEVENGTTVLDEITTSDVVPPAFYLVVVEDKGGDCGEFSGAWPIGFLRAGG
jgi:hypothetical protein